MLVLPLAGARPAAELVQGSRLPRPGGEGTARGAVRDGTELADDVRITVRDSISEVRRLVLPERRSGTEHLTEEELVPLVTRDAMVGVAKVAAP